MFIFADILNVKKVKKLIFIRHGQAGNDYETQDFERKLTDFGIKEIRETASKLLKKDFVPDKIISSSATRTKMTSENICDVLSLNINDVTFDKYIYDFFSSAEFIDSILQNVENKHQTLMIVGHNPSISTTVQMLSGNYDVYFDTANAAIIQFDIDDWKNISARSGKLVDYIK